MLKNLLATTLMFTPLCAEITHIEEISNEKIERFFSGSEPETILELCEGSEIPLSFLLRGDYVELSSGSVSATLLIKRTLFLRCLGENFLFSEDLSSWKEFKDFFNGHLSVHLKKQDDQPQAGLIIELKEAL